MILRWVSILGLAAVACGGSADETDPAPGAASASVAPPGSCAEDEILADGVCEHVGLPRESWCAPGSWGFDGVCHPAGVSIGGCGSGFVHDDDGGCDPLLPSQPCPWGTMAVPGDTACREVAPCAPGTWGDIPVDSTTQHVDPTYMGTSSDGSAQQPWTTIADAIAAAAPGAIVALAAGTYAEDVVIAKPVRLWGRCPALVQISGAGTGTAVTVNQDASAVELRKLSISGSGSGLLAKRAEVLAEEIWVHDNPSGALVIEDYYAKLMLEDSLVEQNGEAGIYAYQSTVHVTNSVVRDTLSNSASTAAGGISANDSTLWVLGTVVERNQGTGVLVVDGSSYVIGAVVRDTLPDASDAYGWGVAGERSGLHVWSSVVERNRGVGVRGQFLTELIGTVVRGTMADARGAGGWGVAGVPGPGGEPGILLVSDSLVEDNREIGVFAAPLELRMTSTLVRGTQPNEAGNLGHGIVAEPYANEPCLAAVHVSVVEDNHDAGIFVSGGEASISSTVVRGTQLDAAGEAGRAIDVRAQAGIPGALTASASLVEQNHGIGVNLVGTDALLYKVEIRDTLPQTDGRSGRAVNVQHDAALGLPASLDLYSVLIESSGEIGVGVFGATAKIEKSIVRNTLASADGRFGDGVLVLANEAPAAATVLQSRIEASARAAVSAFGAQLSLGQSQLLCQALDVALEPWNQGPSVFEDLRGNWCGCPSAQHGCKPVSAGIEAP